MNILFITANRLGDGILSTGVLNHLVMVQPQARVTVACGSLCADLFTGLPQLERIITINKQPRHGHWIKLWQECRKTKWDLIVDLRNSLVSRLLPARQRLVRTAHDHSLHKVIQNARVLGVDLPPAPYIWLTPDDHRRAREILPDQRPVLALGPAANWPGKQWPAERFAAIAQTLLPDAKVLVLAAAHERDQIQNVLESVAPDRLVSLLGADLRLAAACLQRAKLFIGNDSGLMHLAAAVGAPTLGLFGPSDVAVYAPWGKHTAYVRTPEPPAELFKRLPYPGAFYPNLMGGLTVETVQQAAEKLLLSLPQ